jgi:hypothetical protein
MSKEELFNLLSDIRKNYAYIVSFVKIVDNNIVEISWIDIVVGYDDEKQFDIDLREMENINVNEDGFYSVKVLFSVEHDSDDYSTWCYYIPEVVEFEFQISIKDNEELEKSMKDSKSDEGLFDI